MKVGVRRRDGRHGTGLACDEFEPVFVVVKVISFEADILLESSKSKLVEAALVSEN